MRAIIILAVMSLSLNAFTAKSSKLTVEQKNRLGQVLPIAVNEIKKEQVKLSKKEKTQEKAQKSSQNSQKPTTIE